LDADDKSSVRVLIENLSEHDEKITDFRKDLPAQFDKMVARRDQQMREEFETNVKNLETQFGKITEILPQSVITLREVSNEVEGADGWNKSIREARERALNVLRPNGADFERTVSVAWKGEHYDDLAKMYLSLHKDYTELKGQRKSEDESSPDFKGSKAPAPSKKDEPVSAKYRKIYSQLESAQEE
jgi:DNA-binding protein H-NS